MNLSQEFDIYKTDLKDKKDNLTGLISHTDHMINAAQEYYDTCDPFDQKLVNKDIKHLTKIKTKATELITIIDEFIK